MICLFASGCESWDACKGSRERVEAVLLVLWNFETNFCFPNSSPSPLLGVILPLFKYHCFLQALCYRLEFSISFPLLARPLFSWYSAAREVNLLSILFLNLQDIRSWCQEKSSKKVYCLSYLMTHQDLFICGCFEYSSPEGRGYLCTSNAFNIFFFLYKWNQFYPMKMMNLHELFTVRFQTCI